MENPIKTFADAFEIDVRPGGETFYRRKDSAPEWVEDIIFAAHDGALPCDWRYRHLAYLADALQDVADPADFDCHEWADNGADVYNARLAQWLAEVYGAADAVADAQQEWGTDTRDVFEMLQDGQRYMLAEIAALVLAELADRFSDYVAERDGAEETA